jgi:transposase-like protein
MLKKISPKKVKKEVTPAPVAEEIAPTPIAPEILTDRMMRHNFIPSCPECDAFPVICLMKKSGYAAYRCRSCSHQWEVGVKP